MAMEPSLRHSGRRFALLSSALAASTFMFAGAAHAQAADAAAVDEVVVTAQKRAERLQDVPISISVLGGAALDKATEPSVAAALAKVPGVNVVGSTMGGAPQLVVRGVGASGALFAGSSPVAYYVDSSPFSMVRSAIVPDPNVFDLDHIEILRGPQGTLYGASAQGGLARILTHDPDLAAFGAKAAVHASRTQGSGDLNAGGSAAVNIPLVADKLAIRLVGDYARSGGWINAPLGSDLNDADRTSLRLKVKATPTDNLSLMLSVWVSRNKFGAPSSSNDDKTISATLPQTIKQNFENYAGTIDYAFDGATLTTTTSYLHYKLRGLSDISTFGLPVHAILATLLPAEVFTQEVNLVSDTSGATHWSVGAIYRDGKDRKRQDVFFIPAPIDYTYRSKSAAVYGELGHRFFDRTVDLTVGLRYFHDKVRVRENVQQLGLPGVPLIVSDAKFDSVTPRVVLSWHPDGDTMVYGSYAVGFRSGSPQDPTVTQIAPGFPAVKPDKLYNYELGAKSTFLGGLVALDGAIYYMKWDRVQQQIGVPFAGVNVSGFINVGSASGPGADVALTLRPARRLTLGLNASWNDLEVDSDVFSSGAGLFTKGDRLNNSPAFTGGASIAYSTPFGPDGYRLDLSASANFTSAQRNVSLLGTTAFVTKGDDVPNVSLSAAVASPRGWTATLFVDNLTNSYAGLPSVTYSVEEQTPRVRPRTIGVRAEYAY
jgi:outer membrane receptor protein involved in Fe transport